MTSRFLIDDSEDARNTVLLACAEPGAYPERLKPALRTHCVVLRTHGCQLPAEPEGPLGALLRTGRVDRLVVVTHVGCQAGDDRATREPARNTAVLAAWRRHAPVAHRLAAQFSAGRLGMDALSAKLDLLVGLANLEGNAEVHAALARGNVELFGVVHDPSTGELELFDHGAFRRVDERALRGLIGRREREALPHPVPQREGRAAAAGAGMPADMDF